MKTTKIIIGNDHGGYDLKLALINHLQQQGYPVEDIGSHSGELVRYPYYAATVAREVVENPDCRGILICSTGIGMCIIANKFKGIRAALCNSSYQGKMTSAHNNSNILCLGGRCIGAFEAIDIVDMWLNTPYEGGRHDISLGLIEQAEAVNFADEQWDPEIPDTQ
ncbi:ribose 5-phosphate isomerase B [Parapedobacter koreensis]|uniref:Ribose-5-phosphate isomerase n=1 Tax=Parapedobacter koreensis TaxID=332977 RepID=A0A1H7TJV5_9SPHI|nr:ribose 5-phosphate isomerase B [Parapedobacter koreensis]SEL84127.1 ribose-5-phosphate isomerase [Parapedobacter koreensis]